MSCYDDDPSFEYRSKFLKCNSFSEEVTFKQYTAVNK